MGTRRDLLYAALTFCLCGVLFGGPQLGLEPRTFEWGRQAENKGIYEYTFTLKNEGDDVLEITNVRPGCGCTTAPLDKMRLEPGEQTTMHVTLNLPLSNGRLKKRITLRSNDPVQGARLLYLLAEMQRPLQLSSSFIPFNRGTVGETIEGVVTFKVFGKRTVKLTAVASQDGVVIVSPMPIVVEPGEPQDLVVTYTPTKEGPFNIEVKVSTSLKGYDTFDLRGYGSADPR